MHALMKVLELGQELQPITVKRFGDKLYVVDGHHRLAAYAALGRKMVPVAYFLGDLRAAFLKSLDRNIRDKLPITRKDKLEAAFRLVKHKMKFGDAMTWDDIKNRAIVSLRLVYKMQSVLKATSDAWDWSWARTLGNLKNTDEKYEPGSDEFRDAYARKLAEQIKSKIGMNLIKNPDITAKALAMISEALPRALIEEWSDEAKEALIDEAQEANCEEAERALKDAFALLESAREKAFEL